MAFLAPDLHALALRHKDQGRRRLELIRQFYGHKLKAEPSGARSVSAAGRIGVPPIRVGGYTHRRDAYWPCGPDGPRSGKSPHPIAHHDRQFPQRLRRHSEGLDRGQGRLHQLLAELSDAVDSRQFDDGQALGVFADVLPKVSELESRRGRRR